MAYQTYTTLGYICGSYNRNTSDRYYYIFTEDAGMVIARAKSVRDEKSKLRFGLQTFSYIRISLVRGRYGWNIIGVEPISNMYFDATTREMRASLLRVTMLLRRLVHGEVKDTHLFNVVRSGLSILSDEACMPDVWERVMMLNILYELGYVAPQSSLEHVIGQTTDRAYRIASQEGSTRAAIDRSIEHALAASHL